MLQYRWLNRTIFPPMEQSIRNEPPREGDYLGQGASEIIVETRPSARWPPLFHTRSVVQDMGA